MQTQDQIDQQIGATIRRLRGERGTTQAQVAAACGVTFQQIQKYERGVNRVAISTLVPMCRALGCSPAEFVALALEERQDANAPGSSELLRLFSVMRPDQRAAVLNIARAVASPVAVAAVADAEAA